MAACLLLGWDGVVSGSLVFSLLACPVWLLASLARSLVRRPGWRVGLVRLAIPALTFALVLGNAKLQATIADTNAARIIEATERFLAASGRYPDSLGELLPRYLSAVPRAKYSLAFGEFSYWSRPDAHGLVWNVMPPFGRMAYDFERRQWRSLD